jgi:hypothetical protein
MKSLLPGATIVALSVALFVAMPAAAYEALASSAFPNAGDNDLWSLALLGPAAMIFFVTAVGLTITIRSLRADSRRRLILARYWRRGATCRAAAATQE